MNLTFNLKKLKFKVIEYFIIINSIIRKNNKMTELDKNESCDMSLENLHSRMSSYPLELLEIVYYLHDCWINSHVKFDFKMDKFVKQVLIFINLVLDKKFVCENKDFLKMMRAIDVPFDKNLYYKSLHELFVNEITLLYATKSLNRKKFIIFMKEYLDKMLKNIDIMLEENGLISIKQ